MSWQEAFEVGQNIVLATASKTGKPRAIFVYSLGFIDGKLLIGVCQMKISLNNLQENGQVSLVAHNESGCFRLDGESKIYSSGKYFEAALERSKPPLPKQAIVVEIEGVGDLDKAEKII